MHAVIIDPSRVVQGKIAAELEATGCYVDCFSASDLALQYVASTKTVDVVITSLELEPIGGLELCWSLRVMASDKRPLHVIVMSSNTSERALSEALDCGADDFIQKPVGREELRARLRAADRIMSLQRQLIAQTRIDSLTGLLNRTAFSDEITERRAELDATDRISICLCEIDHFKRINDTYGHDFGDEALKIVARIASDEAPIVARIGGEQFALAFPILDAAEASRWCDVVRKSVEDQEIATPEGPIKFTASFGVAEWLVGETLLQAMIKAERALLKAKSTGRNTVVTMDPALQAA